MIASVRPPRALFCTDTYPPQVNGVSVVTATTIAGLITHGWECMVIAPRYPDDARNPFRNAEARHVTGARLVVIPSLPLPGYADIRVATPLVPTMARAINDFAPDLVHCETEFVIGWLGQRLALRQRIPVVSTYHTDFSRYTEAYGVGWLRPTVSAYLARFHRRSARTYTPSPTARNDLRALGVADVEVWGHGVDTDTFHPRHRSDSLRTAYGHSDTCILVHVGRLAAEKGVDRILESYRIARAQLPAGAVHLVIAGSGPKEDALRAAAPDGVTFLGNLDRATVLPRLYASGDAFVFASLTETLGLVVLEAMSSGLPVIASPAGGVADHLAHERNGLAYTAGSVDECARAIVRVVLDPARRRAMGSHARETAERLGWQQEFSRLADSYLEVCARGASQRLTLDALASHA